MERVGGFADFYQIAIFDADGIAAIHREDHWRGFFTLGGELDQRVILQDQGALAKAVWADGRDDEDGGVRRNERPTGGKRVGGGAGGRGDDEAICAVVVE